MQLSIIIVNYNTKKLLKTCIESIIASKPSVSYEIIVVDNGSAYNVKAQISKLRTTTKKLTINLIQNKENAGFGRANNQGVEKSRGDYVLFLNTDIEVLDDAIDKLYSFIKEKSGNVIVGGKLLNPDKSEQPSCGPFYSLAVAFAMLFLQGDKLGLTRYSPNKIRKVDWVSGACFIMRKKDYEKVHGFDENVFMYMEEVELMYRARKRGFKVLFYPKAEMIHIGAASSSNRLDPIINIYSGLLYFYAKHYGFVKTILLKLMLALKALFLYFFGIMSGSAYLKQTYAEAIRLVSVS